MEIPDRDTALDKFVASSNSEGRNRNGGLNSRNQSSDAGEISPWLDRGRSIVDPNNSPPSKGNITGSEREVGVGIKVSSDSEQASPVEKSYLKVLIDGDLINTRSDSSMNYDESKITISAKEKEFSTVDGPDNNPMLAVSPLILGLVKRNCPRLLMI